MATLASPSPPPLKRRRKNWARKCERYCWAIFIHFPLAFVYGLTTWAVWVLSNVGLNSGSKSWTGGFLGLISGRKRAFAYLLCESRLLIYTVRCPPLHPSKLVLYYSRLHRPRFSALHQLWILPSAHPRTVQ